MSSIKALNCLLFLRGGGRAALLHFGPHGYLIFGDQRSHNTVYWVEPLETNLSNPNSKQDHLRSGCIGFVLSSSEYLQGWRLLNLSRTMFQYQTAFMVKIFFSYYLIRILFAVICTHCSHPLTAHL